MALCLAVYGVACFSFSVLVKNSTNFTYTANQSNGALPHGWQGLGGFCVLDLVKAGKGNYSLRVLTVNLCNALTGKV